MLDFVAFKENNSDRRWDAYRLTIRMQSPTDRPFERHNIWVDGFVNCNSNMVEFVEGVRGAPTNGDKPLAYGRDTFVPSHPTAKRKGQLVDSIVSE